MEEKKILNENEVSQAQGAGNIPWDDREWAYYGGSRIGEDRNNISAEQFIGKAAGAALTAKDQQYAEQS